VSHANAALTPKARLRLARLIVDEGWPPSAAARMFMVSTVTARKWAARLRAEGPAGMVDRSSRPRTCPHRTPEHIKRQIVRLRWRQRLGPVQIGGRLAVAPSTVHAVLVRCRMNRLSHIDRVTGEPIRRYEHSHPGSLIHVDVTSSATFPTAAAGAMSASSKATRTARRPPGASTHRAMPGTTRCSAPRSCTPSSTTTPALPTPRSAPTKRQPPPSVSWSGQSPGSPTAASPLNEYSVTTAAVTAPSPGVMPAPRSASVTNAPGPTGRRPTGRSNASTAPWPRVGPTPSSIAQKQNAATPCRAGCTSTITTGPTPHSEHCHQSAGSRTTFPDITASRRLGSEGCRQDCRVRQERARRRTTCPASNE